MGSFNSTCAVSGLPLQEGDPVRILLLTQNPGVHIRGTAHRATNANSWWIPRTFTLRARYNDYGSVQDVEKGVVQDLWLDTLKIDLIPLSAGDNKAHDLPTSHAMSFEYFLEALWENRVRVSSYPHQASPLMVSYAMIREDVWQALLTLAAQDGDSEIDRYKTALLDAYTKELEAQQRRKEASNYVQLVSTLLDELTNVSLGNPYLWIIDSRFFSSTRIGLPQQWRYLVEKEVPIHAARSFIDSVAELSYVLQVLEPLRFMWKPSTSCGPQVGIFKDHVKFFEAMLKIAEMNSVKQEEDYL